MLAHRPRRRSPRTKAKIRHAAYLVLPIIFLILICAVGAGCGPSEPEDDLDALTDAAVKLMSAGRFDEALPVQERIAAADPSDAQIRIELGFNYLNHQGRPADAVRVMSQAVALESSARNLTFLAQAQVVGGDPAGAEESLLGAIAADKAYPYSYAVLVRLLRDAGRSDEAQGFVDQARKNGVDVASFDDQGA